MPNPRAKLFLQLLISGWLLADGTTAQGQEAGENWLPAVALPTPALYQAASVMASNCLQLPPEALRSKPALASACLLPRAVAEYEKRRKVALPFAAGFSDTEAWLRSGAALRRRSGTAAVAGSPEALAAYVVAQVLLHHALEATAQVADSWFGGSAAEFKTTTLPQIEVALNARTPVARLLAYARQSGDRDVLRVLSYCTQTPELPDPDRLFAASTVDPFLAVALTPYARPYRLALALERVAKALPDAAAANQLLDSLATGAAPGNLQEGRGAFSALVKEFAIGPIIPDQPRTWQDALILIDASRALRYAKAQDENPGAAPGHPARESTCRAVAEAAAPLIQSITATQLRLTRADRW